MTTWHCPSCNQMFAAESSFHAHNILVHSTNLPEIVTHPVHYGGADNPYEVIKVIEAWDLNFALGNVLKYICRMGKKDHRIEALKKAKWYLEREIERLEKK